MKRGAGSICHGNTFHHGEGEPATEELLGAIEGVRFDEADARILNGLPDVDLIADEDRAAGGERFDDGDAAVFLVRGKPGTIERIHIARREP